MRPARLAWMAAAAIACGSPGASTQTESLPTLDSQSGATWHCYRIETDDRVSGCYRSASRCDAIRTEMAKRATATECAEQPEAACFSYWSETERKPLETCAVSLRSCRARRQVQLRVAATDTTQPTECEMWPAHGRPAP